MVLCFIVTVAAHIGPVATRTNQLAPARIHSFIHSYIHSFIQSIIHPSTHASTRPSVHSFMHSFIRFEGSLHHAAVVHRQEEKECVASAHQKAQAAPIMIAKLGVNSAQV